MIRKAVITGGVSYHHALTSPGGPLATYDNLDVHGLAGIELAVFDVVVVMRSVDGDALRARRHQGARYLDGGGVLVVFGEAWSDWFPGAHWEAESVADLTPPVMTGHPLLDGIDPETLHWHRHPRHWCNHGHLLPPPGAEIVVANGDGDAWMYIDRETTNGVILATTNLDPDTHAFHGMAAAREVMRRILAWADAEAEDAPARLQRVTPKIAGVFSGVHFQRGFYADAEVGPAFAVVPADELAAADLSRYAAVWIPRESNQAALGRARQNLAAYLAAGGTVVSFDEVNQEWLTGLDWRQRWADKETFILADHPITGGLIQDEVNWHGHGILAPPPGAIVLIGEGQGDAILSLDETTHAPGRVLAGTNDPDCHIGYGNDRPRPLMRRLVSWVLAETPVLIGGRF